MSRWFIALHSLHDASRCRIEFHNRTARPFPLTKVVMTQARLSPLRSVSEEMLQEAFNGAAVKTRTPHRRDLVHVLNLPLVTFRRNEPL